MKKEEKNIRWEEKGTDDQMFTLEDDLLMDEAGDYLKGYIDIEDVKSDPFYAAVAEETREAAARFNRNDTMHTANVKFISGCLSEEKRNADKITAEWVKEWKVKQDKNDTESVERRDFITDALKDPQKGVTDTGKKVPVRTILTRYVVAIAALITGAIFVIKMFIPSDDPTAIYNDFYTPMSAMTSIIRSVSSDISGSYSSAIEYYKKGDYTSASAGFSFLLQNDPEFIPARFFMGLTQMELGKFDDAVRNLSSVAGTQNDFSDDATWYLGFSFLKTGDKISAEKYFSRLAGSKGFYSERAEKIRRRLR